MAMTLEEIQAAALGLTDEEKVLLINSVSQTLRAKDPEIEREWGEEIRRRIAAYDAGQIGYRDAAEVIAELRNKRHASH